MNYLDRRKNYDAVEIARYVVKKCIADGRPISNLQLQKILYFIQKSFLKNRVAFKDDIEAWYKTVQEKCGYHNIIPIQAIREETEE